MPDSVLQAAGAQIGPSAAAPLNTNRFFTGIWTNRSPLRDAATPYLYEKFYSATRYDSIIRGSNIELSTQLTLKLRPGNAVYNAGPFPPANRFFEYRTIVSNGEKIQLIGSFDPEGASTNGTVRDATGPATNLTLLTKDPAAGRTAFLAPGNNTLYMGDGVETSKMMTSGITWKPATSYATGQWINDSNGNIQEAVGPQTATVVGIQVAFDTFAPGTGQQATPGVPTVTVFFDPTTPLTLVRGTGITFAGLTTIPALNGTVHNVGAIVNNLQASFPGATGQTALAYTKETGTVSTSTGSGGQTGPVPPTWQLVQGAITLDGGMQWVNRGSSVQNWQAAAPTTAPLVTQAAAPSPYPKWAASTWYAPLFVIEDANNNLQQLTQGGATGATAPAWATTPVGAVTNDGTAQWTLLGNGAWAATTAYTVGAIVQATFTYYITVSTPVYNAALRMYITVQQQIPVTVTCLFQCITAGTSGAGTPKWVNGLHATTQDNTVVWSNLGTPTPYATLGASQNVSTATIIIDPNFNEQRATRLGQSGATQPAPPSGSTAANGWALTQGTTTVDGTQVWTNAGSFGSANTGAWIYAYSGQNDIDLSTTTASPLSNPVTIAQGNLAVIQGQGIADPQISKIILWRTVQGGSTLLYLDTIPNPGAGQTWVYTDTTPDLGLNEFIIAPINSSGAPPPAGFIPVAFHLGRVWGFVGATLYYSEGPDATPFNGNTSFPPLQQFPLTALGVYAWPTSIGLVVFTTNGSWIILGQGTSDSPLYIVPFQDDIALISQDNFTNQGSTAYLLDASKRVISLDPGAGELEIGFPIADQFEGSAKLGIAGYDPNNTWVAWHRGGSSDTALFVADGSTGWYRMSAIASPESGNVWSPKSAIGGAGVKAILSYEIAPGTRRLILGPAAEGPILARDTTINNDDGVLYGGYVDFGSVVIAQPGTEAGVQFVTAEVSEFSSRPEVGILVDEVHETATKKFQMLRKTSNDPPNQEPSETAPSTRFFAMQSAKPVQGRHVQVRIQWQPEDAPNELFSYTIYGRLPEKARK